MNGHFDRISKILQDFQNNRVLWILQILFMMLGPYCVFEYQQEIESLCLVISFAAGSQKKVSCRE